MAAQKSSSNSSEMGPQPFAQTYLHGTKASLSLGDYIVPGYTTNYDQDKKSKYVFLTSTLDAAIWATELAEGDGEPKIYLVEPTGPIEDDPDLTNQKFPGNPTCSYRSTSPLRVVGIVTEWQGHTKEQIAVMKEALTRLKANNTNSLNTED